MYYYIIFLYIIILIIILDSSKALEHAAHQNRGKMCIHVDAGNLCLNICVITSYSSGTVNGIQVTDWCEVAFQRADREI